VFYACLPLSASPIRKYLGTGCRHDVGSAPVTEERFSWKLAGDSALYGTSAAIAKALALLTVPYLTRALSPEGYGVADLATSTAALLTLIAMFSGDIPAARAYGISADPRERTRVLSSYVWVTIVVTCTVALLLLPVAHVIATGAWGEANHIGLAVLAVLLVPVSGAQAALAQTQRIQSHPRRFAALALVDLLAQLGLAVGLVAAGGGPLGVILGFVLGSSIGLVVALVVAWRVIIVRPDPTVARDLLVEGMKFLPHVTMFVIADWIVRSVVANSVGPSGVAQLGLAIRVASVLTLVSAAFAMAFGPVGLARRRSDETSKLFGRLLLTYGSVSTAGALLLAAVGPELLRSVAGPGYEDAAIILPGFALAYAIAGTEYILVVAAGVSNRASRVALAAALGVGVQVMLSGLLVPSIGLAAIGPAAILGRAVSFSLLLSGVAETLSFRLSQVASLGLAAVGTALGVELLILHDTGWWQIRWVLAGLLLALGWLAVRPLLGQRSPRAS